MRKPNNLTGLLTNMVTHGYAIRSSDLPWHSISLWDVQVVSDRQNTQILFACLSFHLIPDNPNHADYHLLRRPTELPVWSKHSNSAAILISAPSLGSGPPEEREVQQSHLPSNSESQNPRQSTIHKQHIHKLPKHSRQGKSNFVISTAFW